MHPENTPHSDSFSPAFSRRFLARRSIGDILSSVQRVLGNAQLAPRACIHVGTREVHIELGGVRLVITAVASFCSEMAVSAERGCNALFGRVLGAIRCIQRLREQRQIARKEARTAATAITSAALYATQLARLGIGGAGVKSLVDFVDAINRSGFAIVTSKAREGAEDCVYRKPARLAQTMVDIMLRTRARTPGCCDQQLYGTLPGFRLNLSDAQRLKFRPDYVAVHEECEYLGQLHVTLGIGQSPARCASVHWTSHAIPSLVVFTRIGEHGRCAST